MVMADRSEVLKVSGVCNRALNRRTSRLTASWCSTSGFSLSSNTSLGTPPNRRNAPSSPSNRSVCPSRNEARICMRLDLQLATWWNFEPNCRTLLCLQLPSPLPNSKLYRTQADDNPVLDRQLLAYYIRIAVMTEKAFSQPIVQPVKRTAPNRFLKSDTPPSRKYRRTVLRAHANSLDSRLAPNQEHVVATLPPTQPEAYPRPASFATMEMQ